VDVDIERPGSRRDEGVNLGGGQELRRVVNNARRERSFVLGDQYDVPLVTADGSLHLVELKKAHITPLIREHRKHLMVSGEVHAAVSQTQNYLRSLDETRDRVQTEFGINARRVHATVVIGHVDHDKDPMPHERSTRPFAPITATCPESRS
jgi:hypothetical protein